MTNSTRNTAAASIASQDSVDTASLQLAAATFFINTLRVPILPDWGVLPNGACQCKHGSECAHPGKHPAISKPRDNATSDLHEVARWISRGRNLAAVPLSYIVVDIEIKAAKDGLKPYVRWCELAGLDPAYMLSTFTVRSGGGGLHLWYWLSCDVEPPKGLDGWLPDVDIKTARKISDKATIPGSRHASGRRYEFELNANAGQGFNLPLRAPQVLLDEVAAGRAWRPLPEALWPSSVSSGGSVRFGDVVTSWELWRRAEIFPPGAARPPASEYAGIPMGSLSDSQQTWARSVPS